jgi:hypothetical protein
MPELPAEITLDEVRERMHVAGLVIPEQRLELIRGLVRDALRPIRELDSRTVRTLEPAVTFDAAAAEVRHGR